MVACMGANVAIRSEHDAEQDQRMGRRECASVPDHAFRSWPISTDYKPLAMRKRRRA